MSKIGKKIPFRPMPYRSHIGDLKEDCLMKWELRKVLKP